jgi:LPS-assembly protein
MINKLKQSIIIIVFVYFPNNAFSQSFYFESKNIEILDKGNQIITYFGKAISKDKNLELSSDQIYYYKIKDVLEAYGNGKAYIKSKNITLNFDNATFNQKTLETQLLGNIKISLLDTGFTINNDEMFYDQNKNVLFSDKISKIEDNKGNIYLVDSFKYLLNENLIKVKNLLGKDINQNTFETSIGYINTRTKNIFGKDIKLNLKNLSQNNSNPFKLYGNSGKLDDSATNITKGVFTACKNSKDKCPPWQFSAEEIKHDKKKQEISYKNALLKIYNIPVAYFPKFFHPDPTVNRKTGFLIPSFKNSNNSGSYLNLPYYFVLGDNKDLTMSPRFYDNQSFLLQTEYRQKNLDSNHEANFSLFNDKNNRDTKNHIFYEYNKNNFFNILDSSKIIYKLQKTSNDTYLKSQKLNSNLINDNNILENSFNLELFSNNLSVNLNTVIYENLNKKNKSDKYEYILPKIEIIKNYRDPFNLNGNLKINTDILMREHNTNIKEKYLTNNITFASNLRPNKLGFINNHEFLLRNNNSENKNTNYKNKKNLYLSGIYQYNSSYPLIKNDDNFQKILKPRFSIKMAPKHTKNERTEERKVDLTNIYSLDRATDGSSIEGGSSLIYGLDYSLQNKTNLNRIFNLSLANNIRLQENEDLPRNNQIGNKISNIFSEIEYSPNQLINIKYRSAHKNNLNDVANENLSSTLKLNNFVTTFDYFNENNTNEKISYISNDTSFNINQFNNVKFSTRKNKTKDLTEYYKLMYQYKNDCLAASIEYNKDFYTDSSLKPDESILFKLSIIPFSEISIPTNN